MVKTQFLLVQSPFLLVQSPFLFVKLLFLLDDFWAHLYPIGTARVPRPMCLAQPLRGISAGGLSKLRAAHLLRARQGEEHLFGWGKWGIASGIQKTAENHYLELGKSTISMGHFQ